MSYYKYLADKGIGPKEYAEENKVETVVLGVLMVIKWVLFYIPTLISIIAMVIWFNNFTIFISLVGLLLSVIYRAVLIFIVKHMYNEWIRSKGVDI